MIPKVRGGYLDLLTTLCRLVFAASNGQIYGEGQNEQSQEDYYKLVYSIAETSIATNQALKGIAFWRWDAVSSGTILSPLDEALTLSEPPCRHAMRTMLSVSVENQVWKLCRQCFTASDMYLVKLK